MISSTTSRLAASAMQMPHCRCVELRGAEYPFEQVDSRDQHDRQQCQAVAAQLRDTGYCVAVEDRAELVAGQQTCDHVEDRERGEQHGRRDDGAVLAVASTGRGRCGSLRRA